MSRKTVQDAFFDSRSGRSSDVIRSRAMTRGRVLGLIGLIVLIAWVVLPIPSAFVERAYSRGLYPVISSVIVPVMNAVPFSIAGVMLVALPLAGLIALIVSFRRWVPNRTWWARWAWRVLGLIVIVGVWFVLTWGANYRRVPLTTQLQLEPANTASLNVDALRARFERVILENVPSGTPNQARALESVSKAIAAFTRDTTGVTPTLPRRVKRTPSGLLIAGGSAVGVISPWTLEAHVDGALPAVGIVAYGAHELGHVAGFAQESDAEVASAIAGLRSSDAFARYAIALRWWAALRPTDATAWKAAKDRLPSRAQNDLVALSTAIRTHQPPAFLQSFQRSSYDAYLKTQRVPDGIQNYGIAVRYLVVALEKGQL